MLVSMASAGLLSPVVLGAELDANLREIEGLSREDRIKLSYRGGLIAGLLENLGIGILIKGVPDAVVGKLGIETIQKYAQKRYGTRVANQIVQVAIAEGLIEVGQEGTFISIEEGAGKEFKPGEKEARLTEALAGGAVIGGPLGGARAAVTEYSSQADKEAKAFIDSIDQAEFDQTPEQAALAALSDPTNEILVDAPQVKTEVQQPTVDSTASDTVDVTAQPDPSLTSDVPTDLTAPPKVEPPKVDTTPIEKPEVKTKPPVQPVTTDKTDKPLVSAAPITKPNTRDEIITKLDDVNTVGFRDALREEVFENLSGFGIEIDPQQITEFDQKLSNEEQVFTRNDPESVKQQKVIIEKLDEVIQDNEKLGGKEYAPLTGALREYKEYLSNVEKAETNPQEAAPIGTDTDGQVTSVQTPDGQKTYNVTGKVVELSELKQAQGNLQPRDRSKKESTALAVQRAGTMFNPQRLLNDPTSGSGAPIIARDGTIMSGNGRVLTMQEVYANQPKSLEAYQTALKEAGINTEGFSQPVFVRQLNDNMTCLLYTSPSPRDS